MDLFLLHCLVLAWASLGTARRLVAALADQLLAAALLAWVNLVAACLLLSAVHRLGQPAWFFGCSVLLAAVTALLGAKLRPEPEPATGTHANRWLIAAFVVVIVPVALALLAVACVYPPNTPAAFTYHLPRAMYYLGQDSLAHFAAADLRQTHLPFNYDLLQVFGLVYSPPIPCLNVFNFLAWAISGLALYRLSRLCAVGPNASLVASGLALTALPVLAQAATVADDLPAGAALLCALVFGLRWRQTRLTRDALLAGLAAGLAAGSTLDIWLFAPVALLLWIRARRRNGALEPRARRTWLGATLVAFVVGAPFALINLAAASHRLLPPLGVLSLHPGAGLVRTLFGTPLAPPPCFDLTSPLFLLAALGCAWRQRKSAGPLAWLTGLGLGWFLVGLVLPWDWPRNFVPALLLLAPGVAAMIESGLTGGVLRRRAGGLLVLASAALVAAFAGVYLDRNPERPLAPALDAAFEAPALPTLPLLLELRLSGAARVNVDTDGIDEPIFPLMGQRRYQRFTSRAELDPSAYNILSRDSLARNQIYDHPDQFSSYTLLALERKPTAGVEFLATFGDGARARDYFGLERDAAHTPPISANRNLLLTLERERTRTGTSGVARLRLAGLNAPDRIRVEATLVREDGTRAPLTTFLRDGETAVTITRPFRMLVYQAINVDSGAEMGSAAILYQPESDKPKLLDPSRPSSGSSIFVMDLVFARQSKWVNYAGLLPVEGPFPQWDIPYIRWARQPVVTIRIPAIAHLNRLQLAFSTRLHVRRKAGLDVFFNGKLVQHYRIADHVSWLDQTLDLVPGPGTNVLEFRDGPINPEPDWLAYLELYPDVKDFLVSHNLPLEAGAQQHYEARGQAEGRKLPMTEKPEPAPDGYYFMFRNIRLEGFKSP